MLRHRIAAPNEVDMQHLNRAGCGNRFDGPVSDTSLIPTHTRCPGRLGRDNLPPCHPAAAPLRTPPQARQAHERPLARRPAALGGPPQALIRSPWTLS